MALARRVAAIVAAAIAAAIAAAGCGLGASAPPDPQEVVGAACAAIAERGAVDVAVEGESSESSFDEEGAFRWTADVEIDGENYRLLRTFEEIEARIESIRAGAFIYVRAAIEDGEWDDWTLTEAAVADRDQFPYPLPSLAIDPAAETCEHAEADAFRYVGEETVNGRPTQRFAVDLAAQYLGEVAEEIEGEIEGELRDSRDFWIDSDGRIEQVRSDYFAQGLPYFFNEKTVSVAAYSNYGEPNAIAAPPNVTPTPTPTARPLPTPTFAAP